MTNKINTDSKEILTELGFEKFNEMQESAISEGGKGLSLMLLAPTGSGKTIAFLIVALKRLSRSVNGVTVLILVPSRELALQIESVFRSLKSSFKITCCYGGHSFKTEQQSLTEAPAVLIGTPGRILDHLTRGSIKISSVDLVVLDEFDKLLQFGFQREMEQVLDHLSGKPQLILTSASAIEEFPEFVNSSELKTLDFRIEEQSKLDLKLVKVRDIEKSEILTRLISSFNQEPALIFCNHREAVERISLILKREKFEHGIFHGGMEQIDREKNLIKFRSGAHNVLLATDLASRGLDVPVIKHVVHFQCPDHENEFLHRNGRTARMHAEGSAYLVLADDEEMPAYISSELPELKFDTNNKSYPKPKYDCLYVSAGKKDKISKGDILGFLVKVGGLNGNDIGVISILDKSSYVAIQREKVSELLKKIKTPKIKNLKVKIEVAS